jgi:hypothetical protein
MVYRDCKIIRRYILILWPAPDFMTCSWTRPLGKVQYLSTRNYLHKNQNSYWSAFSITFSVTGSMSKIFKRLFLKSAPYLVFTAQFCGNVVEMLTMQATRLIETWMSWEWSSIAHSRDRQYMMLPNGLLSEVIEATLTYNMYMYSSWWSFCRYLLHVPGYYKTQALWLHEI